MSLSDLEKYDLIFLDSKYDINERTVTHKLAIYIEKHLKKKFDIDVDIEYNRMCSGEDIGEAVSKIIDYENSGEGSSFVYPDIIVHKRNTNFNIAVIEVKMAWKSRKKKIDYDKIKAYMEQLNYQYGIFIEIGDKNIIELYPFKND